MTPINTKDIMGFQEMVTILGDSGISVHRIQNMVAESLLETEWNQGVEAWLEKWWANGRYDTIEVAFTTVSLFELHFGERDQEQHQSPWTHINNTEFADTECAFVGKYFAEDNQGAFHSSEYVRIRLTTESRGRFLDYKDSDPMPGESVSYIWAVVKWEDLSLTPHAMDQNSSHIGYLRPHIDEIILEDEVRKTTKHGRSSLRANMGKSGGSNLYDDQAVKHLESLSVEDWRAKTDRADGREW